MSKWDYGLIERITRVTKPGMPESYYSKKSIMSHKNGAAANLQKYVKILLEKLPPETFIGHGKLGGGMIE